MRRGRHRRAVGVERFALDRLDRLVRVRVRIRVRDRVRGRARVRVRVKVCARLGLGVRVRVRARWLLEHAARILATTVDLVEA